MVVVTSDDGDSYDSDDGDEVGSFGKGNNAL